ncbi:type II secretion system F family protein [Thauera sinica]|uniref:Type II secretion system F family protein n=1 Tax=Thauera sinica TaxID=2665146 RepID=A0ABW1ANQ3_9RHOO|nr:type II secretion system F family protein [Thauera sp. K11]ATE60497.1 type II secretion system protein [Thauera sp. K11]
MRYSVRAVGADRLVVDLDIDAGSEAEMRTIVAARGLMVLASKARVAPAHRGKFPLLLFNQELLALLRAGIALAEAIAALAEKETRPAIRTVLQGMLGALREGRTLSSALDSAGGAFPELYVATIRAAERTSDLDHAVERYIAYQQQVDTLRGKLVSAAIYPALLLGVGGLVVLFLMAYVVPRFSHIYEDLDGELPLMSRLLLEWGQFIEAHAVGGAMLLAIAVAGLVALSRHPGVRAAFGRALWRMPVVGESLRVFQLARFYRTLGMLLSGGIPVPTALTMVSGLLTQTLRTSLDGAIARIREGQGFAATLAAGGLTTPVAMRMLEVGERAGNLGDMLSRAAEFHEEDTARQVEWLTRLFGPLLMLFIGGAIGLIVVLMYLPIFQLAESIG